MRSFYTSYANMSSHFSLFLNFVLVHSIYGILHGVFKCICHVSLCARMNTNYRKKTSTHRHWNPEANGRIKLIGKKLERFLCWSTHLHWFHLFRCHWLSSYSPFTTHTTAFRNSFFSSIPFWLHHDPHPTECQHWAVDADQNDNMWFFRHSSDDGWWCFPLIPVHLLSLRHICSRFVEQNEMLKITSNEFLIRGCIATATTIAWAINTTGNP